MNAGLTVTHLWRYPVKSMAGETLSRATLGSLGIVGDRIVQVVDRRGRVATSRTHPRLLGLDATLGEDGEPRVDGLPWSSSEVAAQIEDIVGPGARLLRDESAERFDVLPLLVATDGAIAAFGHDFRRLRPNLVIGGVEGMGEREWEGRCLKVGPVRIGIQDLRGRCIMTSYDPDTQVQDKEITQSIYRRFGGKLALNCFIIEGGEIAVGDEVVLVSARACGELGAGF